jgi:RluA family pseudouridine synthase
MKPPLPFTVIYEDAAIIAVNKAPGVAVGGDRWDESRQRLDTLIGSITQGGLMQPSSKIFTVHRIDSETSGLVVFAKTGAAHRSLSLAFEGREVRKRYIALVCGRPAWKETECDLPLVPNGNKRHMTIIDKYQGKKSLTRFTCVGSAGNYSVLEAFPETGRTHQIRVHAAALGFPIVCDSLYGKEKPVLLSSIKKNWRGDRLEEKPLLARLGLHAAELFLPAETASNNFVNDTSTNQNIITIQASMPGDMIALIRQMEKAGTFKHGITV